MAASSAATHLVGAQFTGLPPGLPAVVRQLATVLTPDQPTRFQKAVALQQFFREGGGFEYDKRRPSGNSRNSLEAFLDKTSPDGRRGYCVHFASALAVMARTIDIPARVAIGFLRPERIGQDTYVYRAHDLHAWPELYFPGSGWVGFEPTTAERAGTVPDYTAYRLTDEDQTSLPSAASSEDLASPRETTEALGPDSADSIAGGADGFDRRWRTAVTSAAALALLGLLVAVPRVVRRHRRERRLGQGAELVWIELRDTVVDLWLAWPAGRSPRETGTHLVQYFGPSEDADPCDRPRHGADVPLSAERALERLVSTIELERYARPGRRESAVLETDAWTVIAALEGGVTRGARRRAEWLPRSLLGFRRRRPAPSSPIGEDMADPASLTLTATPRR